MYKKILIFGAGAIGGYFGAKLAVAGNDVTFVARGKRLQAFTEKGLSLKDEEGNIQNIAIKALEKPTEKYDLIIITVKSTDTYTAGTQCSKLLNNGGAVLSLQNGTENIDILSDFFPSESIIGGVVYSGISVPEPGTILYRGKPKIILGSCNQEGEKHEDPICEIFTKAQIKCSISENILKVMWEKLIWNIAFNPLSALMQATCGELLKNEYSYKVMRAMAEEVVKAANLKGIMLNEASIDKALALNPIYDTYKTSALQDVEANRPPEIEGLMGPVVHSKAKTPVSDTVYNIAQYKFTKWFHTFPRVAADVLVVNQDKILLVERRFPPYGWAIPGGMVDYGETIENAAVRELEEETGIKINKEDLNILNIYSDPSRDPRGHMISMIYYAYSSETPVAGDDAAKAEYFLLDNLPELAFDHAKVIQDFKEKYWKN